MLRRRSSKNNTPASSPTSTVKTLSDESLTSLNAALRGVELSSPSSSSPRDDAPPYAFPRIESRETSAVPSPLPSPRDLSRFATTDELLPSSPPPPALASSSSSASSLSSSSVRSVTWQIVRMGWPSVTTCLIQNGIQLSSTLFLGHVSATALGAATIGNMSCNLTGFAVGMGFTTCLDSLCSQAYGGRQYHLCGLHAQKGLVMLSLACVPVALVWSQTRALTLLIGVDEETAALAQTWASWMTFGMWPFFAFEAVRRWLQAQRVVWPVVVASAATIAWNLTANSVAIYKLGLGFEGPAMVMAASYWVLFTVLALCAWGRQRWVMAHLRRLEEQEKEVRTGSTPPSTAMVKATEGVEEDHSTADVEDDSEHAGGRSLDGRVQRWAKGLRKTTQYSRLDESSAAPPSQSPSVAAVDGPRDCWPPLSRAIFSDWSEHLRLGFPGALSLFLEWGSFEVSASLAASLGPVPLAVHSIYMSTVGLWYMVPLGGSNAAAAIIGNHLGAGEPRTAATTARVAMLMCTLWGLGNGALFVFGLRHVWGLLFIEDPAVRAVVESYMWILFFYGLCDSTKCCGMAILRGCGRPVITVWGNILSCWLVGYPLAFVLLYRFDFGLIGLWTAMTAAWLTATAVYSVVLYRTDWDDECRKARERNLRGVEDALLPHSERVVSELEMEDLRTDELTDHLELFDDATDATTEEGVSHTHHGESKEGELRLDDDDGDWSSVEDSEEETTVHRISRHGERDGSSTAAVVA